MANLAKTMDFKSTNSQKETPLDKTTRIVRRINEVESEARLQKTERLRKARFESKADTPVTAVSGKASK